MRASLAILLPWQSYYGRERVSSSDLKDALQLSNIDPIGCIICMMSMTRNGALTNPVVETKRQLN